jgi:hypothetical protein
LANGQLGVLEIARDLHNAPYSVKFCVRTYTLKAESSLLHLWCQPHLCVIVGAQCQSKRLCFNRLLLSVRLLAPAVPLFVQKIFHAFGGGDIVSVDGVFRIRAPAYLRGVLIGCVSAAPGPCILDMTRH